MEDQLVYVVSNFGRVVGVYRKDEDAVQVIRDFANKGQLADLTIKKLN